MALELSEYEYMDMCRDTINNLKYIMEKNAEPSLELVEELLNYNSTLTALLDEWESSYDQI